MPGPRRPRATGPPPDPDVDGVGPGGVPRRDVGSAPRRRRRCRSPVCEPGPDRALEDGTCRSSTAGDARRDADAVIGRARQGQGRAARPRRARSTATRSRWPGAYWGNASGQRVTTTSVGCDRSPIMGPRSSRTRRTISSSDMWLARSSPNRPIEARSRMSPGRCRSGHLEVSHVHAVIRQPALAGTRKPVPSRGRLTALVGHLQGDEGDIGVVDRPPASRRRRGRRMRAERRPDRPGWRCTTASASTVPCGCAAIQRCRVAIAGRGGTVVGASGARGGRPVLARRISTPLAPRAAARPSTSRDSPPRTVKKTGASAPAVGRVAGGRRRRGRRARMRLPAAPRRVEQGGEHRRRAHLGRVPGVDAADEGIDQSSRDLASESSSGDVGHGPVRCVERRRRPVASATPARRGRRGRRPSGDRMPERGQGPSRVGTPSASPAGRRRSRPRAQT